MKTCRQTAQARLRRLLACRDALVCLATAVASLAGAPVWLAIAAALLVGVRSYGARMGYALNMARIAVVGTLVAFVGLGCGGETGPQATAQATASQACGAMPDAGANGCGASRAYTVCTDPSGAGLGCPSNDPAQTQCPNSGPTVSGGPWTCHDQCKASEYVLSCGGMSPSNPPAVCRFVGATPGGAFYCCPCGT